MAKTKFQQNIIKELGLEELPESTQLELLTAMTESLLKRITIRVLEQLSETEKKEFDKVRETSDPDKINEFLQERVKNYDKMLLETVGEFKDEMKEKIEMLKG